MRVFEVIRERFIKGKKRGSKKKAKKEPYMHRQMRMARMKTR